MSGCDRVRSPAMLAGLASVMFLMSALPAAGFCVRNDTGVAISIEAIQESATFSRSLANNKKACCQPKDQACAIGKDNVTLTISTDQDQSSCQIEVEPKGNVNVTGKPDRIKCKANKAGSTMDWASG